jgi:hypothetical protein
MVAWRGQGSGSVCETVTASKRYIGTPLKRYIVGAGKDVQPTFDPLFLGFDDSTM